MNKGERRAKAAEYVLSERPAGVYRLFHIGSGKALIGSAVDTNAMRNRLLFQLNMGASSNKELAADWEKYGPDAFEYEVLELFKPPENGDYNLMKELERMEAKWMERLQPYEEKGYNKRPKSAEGDRRGG